ncbi:hypothetical protein F511_24004 [Dorcoceras hygrometricum]|uniref:Uncharacterized protein n=1 Tax=Dorcoceras hygrometricum TaxID=472368 RepID=A0A2Z7B5C1_9LAMI|nr:hypothetical protein F511_24004 [Dorcoceras hygrometricum]
MNVKAAGSEIHDKIKKNRKKCEKRMKKLVRKQEEEVQGLLRTWEEEKVRLEKDHKLESAVTCYIHGQGLVRTSKLKILDDKFAKEMEEHNLLKDMLLNSLKEKQLAARNEECQKAAHWLAEAIAYASKLGTENGRQAFGFKFENGPECTKSGTAPENLVTMFQEQAEDPNPSITLCPQGDNVAPSDASVGSPAETADCGCLVETMSNIETFGSPNKVGGVMPLERPPEIRVEQHKQLLQSCNTTEEIGAANLLICGEETTDEIRPVEGGQRKLTRPVSDDIVLHVDPMESNNTSSIGHSIDLPNAEMNHRSEPCQSSNASLPFPGQLLVRSQEMVSFPDRVGMLKQHVSRNEIHQVTSAEQEYIDTSAEDSQNTSRIEVPASSFCDAVNLVQLDHAVQETWNCEQLNHLSADASLACKQYPPHEIEHQTKNQGTNFSLLVAGETEDFSHEFVSQRIENLHRNRLDLGQASKTVISEAVSSTEVPNQSAPQMETAVGHFHESRNNESEITACVQESQNEIQQMASGELEKLDTPAVEPKNTFQKKVASHAATLVQSNHAVPVTEIYEQLCHLSVDASFFCNESPPNEIENQNRGQVTKFSQTVDAEETEEFSHEFVSQSTENLHHDHLYMGQPSRSSHEQGVEVFVSSPDNTVMAQAVCTTELPNQSVPQLGIDAGHRRGPSHLLVHHTHTVTSWNVTPSVVAESLQSELEKLLKEAEQLEKKRADAVSELKSAREKEIQEIINQIRTEYDKKLHDAEANYKLRKNELEKSKKLVLMNSKLAEAFRSKFQFRPLQLQQVFTSTLEHHLHRPSLPPPMRISSLASASGPPPLAPSAEALNQLHMPPPVRSSSVAIRNVIASPPMQATQRAGPVTPSTSARPLVIASHTPAASPRFPEIRSRAPHLQSFRPAVAPSMPPSGFLAIPQLYPQPIFPRQLVGTPRPAPPSPPIPHLMPSHVSQNARIPQNGQPFHLNLSNLL